MAPNPSDREEEEKHFLKVVAAFQNYARYSLSANNRRRKDIYRLPLADQQAISLLGYKQKLDEVDDAIRVNAQFLNEIVENPEIFSDRIDAETSDDVDGLSPAGHTHNHEGGHAHSHSHSHGTHGSKPSNRPTEFDMDKLRSTLKQFVRDWSSEGREEREACYGPMKDALVTHFSSVKDEDRINLRVLVPGAGLGRLAFDIAKMGFACQGNEFSHYMLLSSYFILNRTDAVNQHSFYPYVHSFSNAPNKQSMLRKISIPDVLPSSLPPNSNFSLVAGDFEEVYGGDPDPGEPQSGEWDAIMTCFFIDTAKNIVNYLRIIHKILARGGVWINLGPLLWHWENNESNELSIELDLEEVKALAHTIGFEISNERSIQTTYTNNSDSMLGYVYNAALWTATKK